MNAEKYGTDTICKKHPCLDDTGHGCFLVKKTCPAAIKDGQPGIFCIRKGRRPFAF